MELKVGDVVRLKTGGPPMTVEYVQEAPGEDPMVGTVWFERDEDSWTGPKRESFPVDDLEKTTPAQPEAA